MSTLSDIALKSAYGIDTEDFLDHIAWTEVILPRLTSMRDNLTKELVGAVLSPNTSKPNENKEQIAGKIHGIDYVIRTIESIVREGRQATKVLQSQNITLK